MGKRTRLTISVTLLLVAAGALLAAPAAADHTRYDAGCAVAVWGQTIKGSAGNLTAGNATLEVSACAYQPSKVNTTEEIRVNATNAGPSNATAELAVSVDGEPRASETVELAPGETREFSFDVWFNETGSRQANVTGAGSFEMNVKECLSPYAPYDENCNGEVEIGDLGDAAAAYVGGQITIQELGEMAAAYVANSA